MKSTDTKAHWEKVLSVLDVVDTDLGVSSNASIPALRQPSLSSVFLAVAEKRVVGCAISEPIMATDKIEESFMQGRSRCGDESAS